MSGNSIEILAPAGSPESIYAAVRCGADAVYIGGEKFSARANAVNFSDNDIEEAVNYCHLHNVKIYRALNTIVFDNELPDLVKAAVNSAKAGIDAFIVQDIGAAYAIKQTLPDMKLNASTQMSIHTKQGALLAKELGFSRVVVSRELSLSQIAEICTADIEIEAFIHGALCMSVSGQCFMSALIGSRSANRGLCAQACRLPFSAIEGEGRCDLSLKDMSQIKHIEELKKAGVTSVKIEGRMKRAEYVAAAVSACVSAANGKEPDMEKLQAVFSRSGFTDGYITGNIGSEMFGIRRKEDVVSAEKVLPELKELYRKESKAASADFHAVIKKDRPMLLEMKTDGIKVTITGNVPQAAIKRPADIEFIRTQLSKLGGTVYEAGNITAEIDEGLAVSAAELNSMRREAVEKADPLRTASKKHQHIINEIQLDFPKKLNLKHKSLHVKLSEISQLEGVPNEARLIILPLDKIIKNTESCTKFTEKLCAAAPRFILDEEDLTKKLKTLKSMGITKLFCTNPAHIRIGKELCFELHGGFGLNVSNSLSLKVLAMYGLTDTVASIEMKLPQISHLGDFLPYGIIAYGRIPAMLTRNCPIKRAVGSCKSCTKELTDRTGRHFPVKCDGVSCEIFNSDILVMSDKLREVDCDFIELDFLEESAKKVKNISECFLRGIKPNIKNDITGGLYIRGVQ